MTRGYDDPMGWSTSIQGVGQEAVPKGVWSKCARDARGARSLVDHVCDSSGAQPRTNLEATVGGRAIEVNIGSAGRLLRSASHASVTHARAQGDLAWRYHAPPPGWRNGRRRGLEIGPRWTDEKPPERST
jgi:hypothetical protein